MTSLLRVILAWTICWAVVSVFPASLQAENLDVYAFRDSSATPDKPGGRWAVRLRFNSPVFPSNVASSIKVTVDQVEEKFELFDRSGEKPSTGPLNEFKLVPVRVKEQPATVLITVPKGLTDSTGRRLLQKDYTYQFVSLETISLSGHTTFYRSLKDRGLQVSLSAWVNAKELAKAIKISPEVANLNVESAGSNSYNITGDFELDREYVLNLTSITLDGGRAMLVAKEVKFKGPGIPPGITPKSARSVVELKGRELYPLTLSNVSKVRCRLTRIPPYFVPEFGYDSDPAGAPTRGKMPLSRLAEETAALAKAGKVKEVLLGGCFGGFRSLFRS